MIILMGIWYMVARYMHTNRMINTDDMYQQRGIRIEYNKGNIRIKKYIYPVSKVTAVQQVTESSRFRTKYYIKLEVDDMVKPIHKLPVHGPYVNAEKFCRRLCIALRKAGGPEIDL